jgi:hypothetical protein
MTVLRTLLGAGLAVLLGAAALGDVAELRDVPFRERLLASAIVGGPGFLCGGIALALWVGLQEDASMGPWSIRLSALILGIAVGAANIVLGTLVAGIFLGPFGLLATPLLSSSAALIGGVGLGLGTPIGLRKEVSR